MSTTDPAQLPFPNRDISPGPFHPGPVTVAALLGHLAELLDQRGLTETTLTGQLTGWRRSRSWGRAELTTPSDVAGEYLARIPLGIPGRAAAAIETRIERTHPGLLTTTPTVVVTGGLEIHPRYGPLRFVVHTLHIDQAATAEATAERTTALAALDRTGMFERQQAHKLPATVTTIGLIAGGSTAARADFEERIARLDDHQLHVLEVVTAGPAAPRAIAAAIARLDRRQLDCIAVTRGGGPAVDLSTFDHPDIVTAIGHAATPVLTGLGHATDTTLADRAAHLALPTPSAVADHIIRHNTAQAPAQNIQAHRQAQAAAAAALRRLAAEQASAATDRARLRIAIAACAVLVVLIAALIFVR